MRRREFMALVPAALLLTACSSSDPTGGNPPPPPPPPPPPGGNTVTMNIIDNAFVDPDGNQNDDASVTIAQGDTVRWTNNGSIAHTATSTSVPAGAQTFDTGSIAPGGQDSVTFDVVGTYTYRCEVHPNEMLGATIIVQ